jgi:hypothetical protein
MPDSLAAALMLNPSTKTLLQALIDADLRPAAATILSNSSPVMDL